jgi:hypothetical protein
MMKNRFPTLLAGMLVAAGGTAFAEEAAKPQYIVSSDGQEVLDVRAGLAWRRCVEGMRWNGRTCAGAPLALEHGQAVAWANKAAASDQRSWRLPSVAQLRRLSEARSADAAWATLFPAAPAEWHWSASVNVNTAPVNPYNYGNIMQGVNGNSVNRIAFMHGWAVNFATGEARGDMLKREPLRLRLVRAQLP